MTIPESLTSLPPEPIVRAIAAGDGWLAFDEFMALALYAPGFGYYARASAKFGRMPEAGGGSDFVTAPELSALFGQTLSTQVAQALQVTQTREVWEFGAGSGALALQLLQALDQLNQPLACYHIVDLSGSLLARQRLTLAHYGQRVQWHAQLPAQMTGVVLGNEVLDAMPVKLLVRLGGLWHERGVAGGEAGLIWRDRPTALRPPLDVEGDHDYLTEIHPQGEAFVRTLAERLTNGAVFLIDYGFPEHEYYHPQRLMGTLMCHRAHLADTDALTDVGQKDITAHVNFTGIALAAQDAGLGVLGYATQGRFLINCGLAARLESASVAERVMAQRLMTEHEMGELFKVIGLHTAAPWDAVGFAQGDRTHTL